MSSNVFNGVNRTPVPASSGSVVGAIKTVLRTSPFVYGAKKITFSIKKRTEFWENAAIQFSDNIEALKKVVAQFVVNDRAPIQEFLEQPVSPILALTLCLINENIVRSKIINDYIRGDGPQVYVNKKDVETDEEKYVKALSSYLNIHPGLVNWDGEKYGISNSDLGFEYLCNEGIFGKLKENDYGLKSTDISYLRGPYGYGPMMIGNFLNLMKYGRNMIPDLICGILLSQDSGMMMKDAINSVEEWSGRASSFGLNFDTSSTIEILQILEVVGSYFLTSLLGHSFKNNVVFYLPMSATDKKPYDTGFLMGDLFSNFTDYVRYMVNNKKYNDLKINVFSITVPCIMNSKGSSVNGKLRVGNYEKEYTTDAVLESEPFTQALGVKPVIDDINGLTEFINPLNDYTVSNFVNKGVCVAFIEKWLKKIEDFKVNNGTAAYLAQIPGDIGITPFWYLDEDEWKRDVETVVNYSTPSFTFSTMSFISPDRFTDNDYVRKHTQIFASLVFNRIIKLLNDCNFNFYHLLRELTINTAGTGPNTDGPEVAQMLTLFFDRYAMAILRLIFVNSINTTSGSGVYADTMSSFTEAFTAYIADFIDVDIDNLK